MTKETFAVFGIGWSAFNILEDRTLWIMSLLRYKFWKIYSLCFSAFFDFLQTCCFLFFDFLDWLVSLGDLDFGFQHLLDGFHLTGLRPFWDFTASFSGLHFFLVSLFGFFNNGLLNDVFYTLLRFYWICFLIIFFFISWLFLLWTGFWVYRFHRFILRLLHCFFIFWYRLWFIFFCLFFFDYWTS